MQGAVGTCLGFIHAQKQTLPRGGGGRRTKLSFLTQLCFHFLLLKGRRQRQRITVSGTDNASGVSSEDILMLADAGA